MTGMTILDWDRQQNYKEFQLGMAKLKIGKNKFQSPAAVAGRLDNVPL